MRLMKKDKYDYSTMLATLIFLTGIIGICLVILACSKYLWDTTAVGFLTIAYVIVSGFIISYKPDKGSKDERL